MTKDYQANLDPENYWNPALVNEFIQRRYRDRGFKIYWLLFGMEEDPRVPDQSLWSRWYLRDKEDMIISCGITLSDQIHRIYPRVSWIIGQLPEPLDMLVIAGFHFSDCVHRVASYAHGIGLRTWVDRDLTDNTFQLLIRKYIPVVRREPDNWHLQGEGVSEIAFRELIKVEPWLDPAAQP